MSYSYYYMRFPEGKTKALTLSYDDGVEQDAQLIRLMEQYGFKGTFNLNAGYFAPEGKVYPPGYVKRRFPLSKIKEVYSSDGTYNDQAVEILNYAGIHYARTVESTERFDIPTDWLRMPATKSVIM